MGKTILSVAQQNILDALASNQVIFNNFYLTGGTALAEFYLHHRFSEDLDFFSEHEVDQLAIQTVFKIISHKTHIKKIDFEQSFKRNLFFLHLPHEIIIDIAPLEKIGDAIHVRDIKLPKGVKVCLDEDQTIAFIEKPMSEEELAALETPVELKVDEVEVVGEKEKKEAEEAAAALEAEEKEK